jgi:hypothetical protein
MPPSTSISSGGGKWTARPLGRLRTRRTSLSGLHEWRVAHLPVSENRPGAAKDVEAIVVLYSDSVRYRALVLREPELGVVGVRADLQRTFGEEDAIECRFGEPVAGGDRAAVEWWSSWTDDGNDLTMAGVTVLRFDADGMVVDHRDY